jgi:hypothetical protein
MGRDGAAPRAAGDGAGRAELDELRRRVEALERRAAGATPPAPAPGGAP